MQKAIRNTRNSHSRNLCSKARGIKRRRRTVKIFRFLLNKIIAPLVVALLTFMIISIASKIDTGDWMEWFGLIPRTIWIIFGLIIFLWIIVIAIRNRFKQMRKLDAGSGAGVLVWPTHGWTVIGKRNYSGVVWRICVPAPSPWRTFDPSRISVSSIDVETPPRCPDCETELEERHSFWGAYIWRCVKCDFKKRSWDSCHKVAKRVEKIARREWELRRVR